MESRDETDNPKIFVLNTAENLIATWREITSKDSVEKLDKLRYRHFSTLKRGGEWRDINQNCHYNKSSFVFKSMNLFYEPYF